ncbi:Small conductance calcium-activated potassium channel protein 2 [Halocaridina rubra]|uniref:Small conductance calcium-activated potassium channel protein 2 n=1 Tax=Halocaridina rubra TaxID=373956 RepID=A0AAN8WZ96_HALRR
MAVIASVTQSFWNSICACFGETQNTVYELVSDMSGRQDVLDERVSSLEDRLTTIQESLEALPDVLSRCLQKHQEVVDQRRATAPSSNSLHPDMAARPGGYPVLSASPSPRSSPVWQQQSSAPPLFPRTSLSPTLPALPTSSSAVSSIQGERSPTALTSLSGQSLPKSEA